MKQIHGSFFVNKFMPKIILVFGLPNSGKTTFAQFLLKELENFSVIHLNADVIRAQYNDWDFSENGRRNQALRMKTLASQQNSEYVICDFVCPYNDIRMNLFDDCYRIFLNTIKEGRYEDTNKIFEMPNFKDVEFIITDFNQLSSCAHTIRAILEYQLFDFAQPSS